MNIYLPDLNEKNEAISIHSKSFESLMLNTRFCRMEKKKGKEKQINFFIISRSFSFLMFVSPPKISGESGTLTDAMQSIHDTKLSSAT